MPAVQYKKPFVYSQFLHKLYQKSVSCDTCGHRLFITLTQSHFPRCSCLNYSAIRLGPSRCTAWEQREHSPKLSVCSTCSFTLNLQEEDSDVMWHTALHCVLNLWFFFIPPLTLILTLPPIPYFHRYYPWGFLHASCENRWQQRQKLHRANFLSAAQRWHPFNYCRNKGGRHGLPQL